MQGADQCRQLFEMLPSSKHTIATFDVQPISGQRHHSRESEWATATQRNLAQQPADRERWSIECMNSRWSLVCVASGGEMRGMINCLLVNVTGSVVWGMSASSAAPSGFYHTFVLERRAAHGSNGKQAHHVVSASMRTRFFDEDAPGGGSHQGKKKRAFNR